MDPQGPDRSSIIGILLISLLLVAWLLWQQPPVPEDGAAPDATEEAAGEAEIGDAEIVPDDDVLVAPSDSLFAAAVGGRPRKVVVATDHVHATFSTQGGTLVSLQMLDFTRAGTDEPVELVSDEAGAIALGFNPPQGRYVDTRTLSFRPVVDGELFEGDTLRIGADGGQIAFEAPVQEGALRLAYGFSDDDYEVDFRVEAPGTDLLAQGGGYEVVWDGGLPLAEADVEQEVQQAGAYVRLGGETSSLRLDEEGEGEAVTRSGQIEWVAVKTKFFLAALLPGEGTQTQGAVLTGDQIGEADGVEGSFAQTYAARVEMPALAAGEADAFTLYMGPLELRRLGQYGLYDTVDFGFGQTITRPIARYLIAPAFAFLSTFIPSYGLVVLVFALLVKLLLWPLTAVSYRSAARMREVQPKMAAIKEKYGDDPQKQQEATLKLYKEEGVNPLGGCLPMLLQYPILISLWRFFQSTLVLRGEGFLWAQDLSAPDPILQLPFTIPFYGDFVAGFTLLMGLSMMIQMRLTSTGAVSGQQKVIMYVLPVTFFFFFNRFPSGLSLYYLGFNALSIVQQRVVNRQVHKEKLEAEANPKPRSNGRAKSNGKADGRANGKAKRRKKDSRSLTSRAVAEAKKRGRK